MQDTFEIKIVKIGEDYEGKENDEKLDAVFKKAVELAKLRNATFGTYTTPKHKSIAYYKQIRKSGRK